LKKGTAFVFKYSEDFKNPFSPQFLTINRLKLLRIFSDWRQKRCMGPKTCHWAHNPTVSESTWIVTL